MLARRFHLDFIRRDKDKEYAADLIRDIIPILRNL